MSWNEHAREHALRNAIFDGRVGEVDVDKILERAEIYFIFLTNTKTAEDKLQELQSFLWKNNPQGRVSVFSDDDLPTLDLPQVYERIRKLLESKP